MLYISIMLCSLMLLVKMPRSYSEYIRRRAVWLAVVRVQEIASVLFMCEKSAHRYLALFHSTGSVAHWWS